MGESPWKFESSRPHQSVQSATGLQRLSEHIAPETARLRRLLHSSARARDGRFKSVQAAQTWSVSNGTAGRAFSPACLVSRKG